MKNIGIDIGGTFIKAAIVEGKGRILLSSKTPTPPKGEDIPKKVVEMINKLIQKADISIDDISSVGIGAPGVCDSKKGVIVNCPNIADCKNISICQYVTEKTGVKAYLDNDANCAALGEYMLEDVKSDSFVFITLGTGIGGGIILNGKILRGINSAAGEVGHIVIVKDGEKCNCGRRGCWERYASVSALVRSAKAVGFLNNISGKTIFEEMQKGNKKAEEVIFSWILYVAEGICDMINIFQPDVIVIGGGISREGDNLLNPIRKFVDENTISDGANAKKTDVKISKMFNDAGVVGASFLYTQN